MSDVQELEEFLQSVVSAEANAHLFLINREKIGQEISFEVFKTEVSPDVSASFVQILVNRLDKINFTETNIVEYTIDGDFDEHLQYIKAENVPNFPNIYQAIDNHVNTPSFEGIDPLFLKKLWSYAVTIEVGQEKLTFFRKYSKSKVLKGGLFALFFNAGHFSKIEDSEVFQFDEKVDCIFYKGNIWIFQSTYFEQIFGYEEKYLLASAQTLQVLKSLPHFEGFEILEESVAADSRKRKKLASILQNGYYASMNFETMKRIASNYGLKVQFDNENEKIIIEPKTAFEILKLLNDDYLRSEATSEKYEVPSKRKR